MSISRSRRRQGSIVALALALALACAVGAVLLQGSLTSTEASPPCAESSTSHHTTPGHVAETEPDWVPPQVSNPGLAPGERLLTPRQAAMKDARSFARLDRVSVAVALSRLRDQGRLDAVIGLLTSEYPDTYAGAYIAQHPYRTTIRFCGPVPERASAIVRAHHLTAVFDDTAQGSERALNRASNQVANAVAALHRSSNVGADVRTGSINVLVESGHAGSVLSASERATIESAVDAAAGPFAVRISYARGPIAIAQ